jgi:hypothetical protein
MLAVGCFEPKLSFFPLDFQTNPSKELIDKVVKQSRCQEDKADGGNSKLLKIFKEPAWKVNQSRWPMCAGRGALLRLDP